MPSTKVKLGVYLPGADEVVHWNELKALLRQVERRYGASWWGPCLDKVLADVVAETRQPQSR
jgi:hypothetical protein